MKHVTLPLPDIVFCVKKVATKTFLNFWSKKKWRRGGNLKEREGERESVREMSTWCKTFAGCHPPDGQMCVRGGRRHLSPSLPTLLSRLLSRRKKEVGKQPKRIDSCFKVDFESRQRERERERVGGGDGEAFPLQR
jgi:hypothetical protein